MLSGSATCSYLEDDESQMGGDVGRRLRAFWSLKMRQLARLHDHVSSSFISRLHHEVARKGHVAILIPLLLCSLVVTALFAGIEHAAHASDRKLKRISSPWDLVLSSSATDPAWRWGAAVKSAAESLRNADRGNSEWQLMRSRLKEEVHRMRYELARLESYLAGEMIHPFSGCCGMSHHLECL